MTSSLQTRQQALALGAITLALFWPTLSAGFVYDARLQILTGDFIHDPWSWLSVISFGVLGMDVLDFNRPVHLASLMLDAALWGKEPFGYHLTSVLVHAVNVVLVWAIVRQLVRDGRSADAADGKLSQSLPWLAALIFAVHPIVTEAVCEPTFREDLLVAACTLGALLLAMQHEPTAAGGDRWRAFACAGLCFLAVASKESGIAAPLVLGAYWWLFRCSEPRAFWLLAIGGGKAAAVAFLAARFLLEPAQSAIFEAKPQYPGGSLAAALALEPRILALYVQLILFPINQSADYGLFSVRHLPLTVALSILGLVAFVAFRAVRADRRMLLPIAMIVLPLLPVSNLIPIYRAAADRYLYLPMAGVAVGIGLAMQSAWITAEPRRREIATIGCMTAIAVLGLTCIQRQQVWRSSLALWEDTFRKMPVSYTAASGYGEALREAGRLADAERATREAIRLSDGKRGDPWATLAVILDAQGRPEETRAAMAKALELDPKLADPEQRVRALAMERGFADEWRRLLDRQK